MFEIDRTKPFRVGLIKYNLRNTLLTKKLWLKGNQAKASPQTLSIGVNNFVFYAQSD